MLVLWPEAWGQSLWAEVKVSVGRVPSGGGKAGSTSFLPQTLEAALVLGQRLRPPVIFTQAVGPAPRIRLPRTPFSLSAVSSLL